MIEPEARKKNVATVVELRPRAKEDFTQSLGMLVALGSWAMMFGALFFMYFGLRARSAMWPPIGVPHLPLALPLVNTLVLVASSATLSFGVRDLARGRRSRLRAWVASTIVLGASFLALQFVVWRGLWNQGLLPSSGAYGSVFYGFTVLHALHVLAGVGVLCVVLIKAFAGSYTEHNVIRVRLAAMFWHFVDVVWVLMFISLYVP